MRDRSVHFTDEELATLGSFDEEPNVSLPESTDTPMAEDNAFEGSSVHDLLFPDLNSRVPKSSFSYEDAAEEVRNPRPMTTALERLETSLGEAGRSSDVVERPNFFGIELPRPSEIWRNLPGSAGRLFDESLEFLSPQFIFDRHAGFTDTQKEIGAIVSDVATRVWEDIPLVQAHRLQEERELQRHYGRTDETGFTEFSKPTTKLETFEELGTAVELLSPLGFDQGRPEWRGTGAIAGLIEEEPAEFALELAGAGFGAISRVARTARRATRSAIDDITFADTFDFEGVDVLEGRGALSAQERLAQATVQLRAYEGSRLRKVGTAVRTEEGLLTASHTLIGTPRRVDGELTGDLNLGQIHTRTLGDDPEFGAVRGILEIDPEQDIALLEEIGTGGPTVSLAEAVEAGTQQLGYGASGRLAEVHTPRGHVIGEEVESERGGVLGFTSARSVGGVSGAGLVSPEGDLTGIYLGTLERGGTEVGMFTPARGIERMLSERDVSAESLPVSQLDSRANLERLYGEGLAQRVRRRDPGLTIRDTGPFATGLFTEDAALPGDTSLDLQSGDPSFQDEGFDIEESADLSEFERRLERRYSGPEGKVPFEYDPDQTFSELIRAVSQEEGVFFRIGRRDEDLSKLVTPEDWRSYYRPAQATEFGAVGELESLGRSPGDEIHYLQRETGQRKDVFYEGVVAQSDYSGIFERLQELEYKERTGQVEPGESTLQILTGRVSREWSPTLLKKERLGDPETRVSDYLLTDAQVLFEFEGLPASTQYGEQRVESFRVGRETPYEAPELTGLVEPRERWVEPEEVDDVSEPRVFADMEPLVRWYREREAEKIKLDRPGMYAAGIRTREALPPPTDIERVQMPAEPPFMPSNIKKLRAIEARQMKEVEAAKPSYEEGFALDVNDPSYYQRMEDDVEGASATIGSRNLEMGDVDLFEDHQDVDDPYFFDYEEGRKADEPYLKDYTEGFKEQDYKPEVWQSKDLDPEKGIWEEKEVGTDWIEEYGETDSELGSGLDRDTGMLDPMLDEPEGADSYGIYGFSSEVKEVIDDIGDDFKDRVELRIAIESKDPDLRARIIQEETQRDPDWRERQFIEQIETDFEKAGVPLPEFDLDVAFADVISKLEDPDGWRDRYQEVKDRGDANELSRFIAPVVREVTTAHADWYESLIPRLDLLLEEGDQKTSIYRDSLGWQNKALSSDIVDLEISEVDTQREIQRALEEKDKIVEDLRFARGTENEIGFRQELEEQEKRLFSLRSSERDITRRKERLASTLEKSLETRDADADAVDPIDPIDPEERRFALEDITDIRSALREALDPGQLQGDLLQFRQDIIQEEVLADRIQRREKRDPSRRATLPVRSDILRGFAEKRLDSPEFGALLSDRRISDISSQVQTDFTWTERVTGVLSRGRVESLGGELDIFGLRSFDLSRDRVRDFGETVFLAERSQTRTLGAVDSESMGFRRGVEFTGIELDPPQELAESYISEARSYVTDEELAAAWHISEYQETALRSRVMGDTFTRWVEEQRSPEVRVLAGRSAEELFSEYDDPSGRRTPERNAALQRLSQVRGEVSAEGLTDLGETVFQAEVSQARALEIERGRSLGVEPSETLRTAEEFRQRSREREASEYARMSYELEKESRITARAGSPRISAESRVRPREFEQEQRLRDIERLTKSREDIDTRIAEGVDDPDALRQRDAIDKQIEILESDSSIKYHSGDIDVPRPLDLSQSQARRRNVWDIGSERTYGIELELITNLTRDEMLGELDPQVQRGLELTYDTSIRTVRDDVALESVAKTPVGEEIVFREEARQYKRYIDEWGDRDETQLASPSDFDTQFAHELVFPVMQGAEGLDFIGQTFERLQDLEVELNTSMGLHVHVGGADLSNYDLTGVLTAFSGREGVIDLMSEPSRRGRGALYAESLVEGEPELLPRHRQNLEWAQEMATMGGRSLGTPKERLGFLSDIGYGDRYQKLNLGGFGGRTIEYRQPGPSLELSEVSSHIGFITNFVDRFAGASFQEAADIPRSLPERLSELDLVFEEPSRPGQLITGIEYHSGLDDPDAYRYAAAMGLDLPDPPAAMAAQSWYSREEPVKQVVKAPGQQAVDESMVDFLQGPDDLGDISDQDVFEEVPTDFFDPAPVPEELPPDFFDTSPVPEDLGTDYFDPDPVFEEMSPDLFEELPDSRAVVPGSEPQLAITGQKYLPTASQQRALEHTFGPAVVLAGPGSGKSQTLIGRLKELTQQNVAIPDDILTLVFGKKAQEELTERTRSIGGDWNIKTIDAFAYSVVREHFEELGYERSPDITSENFESWLARSEDFLTTMDISLDFEQRRSWGEKYERARRDVVSGREDYSDLPENVQRAIHAFRAEKFKSSQVDFSDVISQAGYLLETNPELRKRYQEKFPFVQIDEFQDVSLTQHRLLSNLSENLWAVGDLDQSIMSFRGGSGEVMQDMIYRGASLYNIEENFRSIPEIVEGAQGFIRESPGRFDLQQEAVRSSGDPISLVPIAKTLSERDVIARVAEQIQPDRQTAILTRTRRERDTYQSQVSARLEAMGWEQEQIEGSLTFETLHGSKGLQWEDVILPINLLDSPYGKGRSRDITLPSRHAKTAELLAEEERLFYVGMTRAEDRLTIMGGEQHAYFERVARVTGQKKEDKVADFLGQIPSPGQAVTGALDALERQAEKRPAPARKEAVVPEEAPESESKKSGLFGRALQWGKEAVKESIEGALDQYLTGDSLKREGRQALGQEDRVRRQLREKRENADDDIDIDLQAGDVPEGTRYASEHMMRPEHFQSAMDRGFLSGQVGRSRGLLYFSEGAHYREKARGESYSHGFIFDPEVLEDEFGAVVPENRLDAIMRASGRDLGESDLAELLEYQRQYDVNVEPDFTVKEDVPLEYAIGITDETGAYWIDPETRSDDPNRWDLWSVEDEELGGLEPGSFAGRGVGSLIIPEDLKIDLHSGRPDLSTPEGMASYWSQVQKRGRKFREHTGEYDRSHLEDLGRTKLLPEDFEEAEQTHIDFGDFKIDLHAGDLDTVYGNRIGIHSFGENEKNEDGSYRKSGFEFDQHGGIFEGFNPWLDVTPEGILEPRGYGAEEKEKKPFARFGAEEESEIFVEEKDGLTDIEALLQGLRDVREDVHLKDDPYSGDTELDTGYIYRLQNLETDKIYVGLSKNHPLGEGGRIRSHFGGTGSKEIKKDLQDYDPSDFSAEFWSIPNLGYQELGYLEKVMIERSDSFGEGGYNLTEGGEIGDDKWDFDPDFFRSPDATPEIQHERFEHASVPLSYPEEMFGEDYFTLDEKDQIKGLYDAIHGQPISERQSVIRRDAPDVDYRLDIPEDIKIDITDATPELLQEIPGIHSRLAKDIVRYQETIGDIETFEALGELKGMSDERLAEVSRYVKIPGSTGDEQAFDDPKEIESEVWEESLLDINLASAEELADLPGLGDVTAQRIVESREQEGVFPSLHALTRVKGVGKTAVEKLEGFATPAGIMDHPGTDLVGTGLEERGILELDVSGRAEDDRIDLNLATAEELQELKGIGPSIAERIVGYRDAKSGLADISELQEVRGISERMVEGLLEDDSVKLTPVYPFGEVFGTDAPFSEYPAAEDITGVRRKPYLQAPLYRSQDTDEVPLESGFEYALKKYQEEHGKTVFPGDRAARRGGRGGMAPEEEMSYLDVFSYIGMDTLASIPSDLFTGFAQKSDVNAQVAERLKKLEAEQEELKESIEADTSLTVSQRQERLEGLETRYAEQQERIEGYTVTGSDVISGVAERAGTSLINRGLSFAGDQLLNKAAASPFAGAVKGAVSKGISALKPLIPAAAPVALVAGAALVGEASLNAGYEDVVPSAQDRKNAFESQFVLQTDGGVTSWQQGWAEGYRAARSETGRGGDAGAPARLEDFITDNFVKVIDRKLRVLTAKGITRQN